MFKKKKNFLFTCISLFCVNALLNCCNVSCTSVMVPIYLLLKQRWDFFARGLSVMCLCAQCLKWSGNIWHLDVRKAFVPLSLNVRQHCFDGKWKVDVRLTVSLSAPPVQGVSLLASSVLAPLKMGMMDAEMKVPSNPGLAELLTWSAWSRSEYGFPCFLCCQVFCCHFPCKFGPVSSWIQFSSPVK